MRTDWTFLTVIAYRNTTPYLICLSVSGRSECLFVCFVFNKVSVRQRKFIKGILHNMIRDLSLPSGW